MEAVVDRRRGWRVLLVPLLVALLAFGYLALRNASSAPSHRRAAPARLTAGDLLLAASKVKGGIFLQYDNITTPPGADHTGHAPLASAQWGIGRPISGGLAAGRPTVSEMVISKQADKFSVPLINASLSGSPANAIVYFTDLSVKGQPVDYMEIDLEHVLVSGYSMSSGGGRPSESISLNFTKLTVKAQFAGSPSQIVTFDFTVQT